MASWMADELSQEATDLLAGCVLFDTVDAAAGQAESEILCRQNASRDERVMLLMPDLARASQGYWRIPPSV